MKNIDFKKYKRLFAFGCSFTCYIMPTWADLIYKSCNDDIQFFNCGKSGGGNLFIAHRITEANRKYNFNEDDLIIVMWSTFARLDFYRESCWITPGNILSQSMLSKEVVKELFDLNWFLMRDLSVIDLSTTYLKSLNVDYLNFMSVPMNFDHIEKRQEINKGDLTTQIIETYKCLNDEFPTPLYTFLGDRFSDKIKYYHEHHKEIFIDYHPTIDDYRKYLQYCGVPLTQKAIDYANSSQQFLLQDNLNRLDIVKNFKDIDSRCAESYRILW